MRTWQPLEQLIGRIEQLSVLDRPADLVNGVLRKAIPQGSVEDALSGTPIGHPLHPAMVTVPIGAWTSSLVFDVIGDDTAARRLIAIGCVSALPTAAAGAADWMSTHGPERRVGLVHALLNYTALGAYAMSWLARRRGRRARGVMLSLAGAGLVSASGWLGGHLSYSLGIGVDTTVFEQLPEDWTDVTAETVLPADGEFVAADAGGVPVLLSRHNGTVTALADRCTHRGGPLHEGELDGGCVVCPWHGSAFSLADGSVQAGPATRPQAVLETRIENGRLQVRRQDRRTMRTQLADP
ncbi:MAG: Rieske 2Fe-2S domain-containing protein [Jatrophihabitans sp.]|uniref:Rieske 2Fe-2S domain-containing protein n=1 Tax=Jatrophihabitans sp. TaxID=1932789 RepID=UPI003915AECF